MKTAIAFAIAALSLTLGGAAFAQSPASAPDAVSQLKQDNAQIRKDNRNIQYQRKEIAQDNARVGADKARIGRDERKLADERAERNADQRAEDAAVKRGDLAAAKRDEKAREQENRDIGGLKRNEAHAKADLSATRADRHQEYKELGEAKAKKAKDVHKRNADAAKVN
jgi:hypothetical protein